MTADLKNHLTYNFSIEELVFANRNKAYGAYVLRRSYPKNLMLAFGFAVTLFLGGITAPLLLKSNAGETLLKKVGTGSIIFESMPVPSIGKTISVEDLSKLIPKVSTFKYMAPIVRPDENVIEDYSPDVTMLKNAIPGLVTRKGMEDGVDVTLIDYKEPVNNNIVKDNNTEENTIFTWAEEMPRYAEGEEAMFAFLTENIHYPELARKVGIEGKVMVNFNVERNGTLSNVRIIKSIGGGCDEEALRVVSLMTGKWKAGKQNGRAVKVNISIPIVFRMN